MFHSYESERLDQEDDADHWADFEMSENIPVWRKRNKLVHQRPCYPADSILNDTGELCQTISCFCGKRSWAQPYTPDGSSASAGCSRNCLDAGYLESGEADLMLCPWTSGATGTQTGHLISWKLMARHSVTESPICKWCSRDQTRRFDDLDLADKYEPLTAADVAAMPRLPDPAGTTLPTQAEQDAIDRHVADGDISLESVAYLAEDRKALPKSQTIDCVATCSVCSDTVNVTLSGPMRYRLGGSLVTTSTFCAERLRKALSGDTRHLMLCSGSTPRPHLCVYGSTYHTREQMCSRHHRKLPVKTGDAGVRSGRVKKRAANHRGECSDVHRSAEQAEDSDDDSDYRPGD